MKFFCLLVSYLKSRKFFYRQLLITAILVAAENSKFAKPAQAQSTLACNNIYVSVKSGSPTNTYPTGQQFHQLDWSNGTIGTQLGTSTSGVTGGIGIDPNSKNIYYIDGAGGAGYGTSKVGRIYSFDGSSSSDILTTIGDPTTEHQAGMDLSGVLWATKWTGTKDLYSYNPTTNTVSTLGAITASPSTLKTEWETLAEGDFAFDKDNVMWYVSTYNSQVAIWKVNRSTRVATKIGNYGSITGTNHVVTGGAFGPDGKLYIGTSLGHIYKFDTVSNTLTGVKTTTGSTITDMTSCMYPSISISGNVWHDQDNSAQNSFSNIKTGSETGTNGGGLNAFLLDANNKVIASSAVANNGSYSFPTVSGNQSALKIRLSTTSTTTATVGSAAPMASLPGGWEGTSPLEITSLNTGTTNITNQDFGIYQLDYGDAPDTGAAPATAKDNYQTISSDGGPSHVIVSGIALGTNIDADSGALQNANADADDTSPSSNPNDEDGVKLGSSSLQNQTLFLGNNSTLNIATQGAGKLSGWIDWNQDGDFLDTGEKIATDVTPTSNAISLSITVPTTATTGTTYARFRYSTQAGLASTGAASNGEIEDYKIAIAQARDYGDAPDANPGTTTGNYKTTLADGGASQAVISASGQVLKLGSNLDQDSGALHNSNADADDNNGTDDEDGVSSFPILTTTAGQAYIVPVTVSNNVSTAYLVGYLDFNKDGDFLDAGEKSDTITVSSNGATPRTFNVTFPAPPAGQSIPPGTPTGMTTGNTFARFRLSQALATAESSTGASADTDYGEIEDYQVTIAPAPTVPTSVTSTCTAPASLVSPSAFTLNSSNYALSSPLQSLITPSNPLSLYNGTMRFNATLSGAGTWGNGVQLRTDATFGNHLYLQPQNTNAYITSGNKATYEFLFPSGVKNFSTIVGGLNNYDGTTITASYQGTPIPISAANFSNLSTGMTLSDTNIDTDTNVDTVISTNTTGGVEVTENIYTLTIPELIDKITVYSGKDGIANVSTATIGFSLIGYCANFDYGDAPDTYGTDSTNSSSGEGIGARHGITSTLKLGANTPDAETNAPSTLNGTGDDSTGTPDDEDGIATPFPTLNTSTSTYSLTATVNNTTGSAANIYAWIDFDGDGKFDGDERATVSNGTVALSGGKVPTGASGNVILTWDNLGGSGANIVNGASYARIRLTTDDLTTSAITSTARDTASVGTASNGEVEDYPIAIAGTDYGDAPDTYGTDKTDSGEGVGARHTIITTSSLRFGATNPDAETDAKTPLDGTGDDINGTPDDEDGITTFPSLDTATNTYSLTVRVRNGSTTNTANVYGWIDFDGDGKFDGDERATVNSGTVTLVGGQVPTGANGNVILTWDSLGGSGANIVNGKTYARIRITTDNLTTSSTTSRDPASVGHANSGEVEDYPVAIAATDYGDAPDTYGTNSTDDNGEGIGARHMITSALQLGTNAPDGETNAPSSLTGTQDDTTGIDDEDAFTTLANVPTVGHYNLTVPLSNNGDKVATLRAWVDFDRDGKFEAGEYKSVSVPINATSVNLSWVVPGGMTAGSTYARFRLTSTALTDDTTTANQDERSIGAANDGEVEDYPVAIAPNGNPPLPPDFCQISTGHNFLFVLDDSSSVIPSEVQQQKDAVMATLNSFIAKGLTGQAAIVGFDTIGRKIIDYTDITAANLGAFQTALNNNYGVDGSGTNWEAGLQAGVLLGVSQPDAVFFFTDGTQNTGASPEDEATQFKLASAHIFGIGIELTIEDGFRHITDGDDSVTYNGSNALEADYVDIDDYASLESQYTNDFLANLCSADFGDALDTYGTDNVGNNSSSDPLGANHRIVSGLYLGTKAPDAESNGFADGTDDHNNATDDNEPNGTGTGNGDDEGSFTFPTLNTGKKGYRIPAANITVTNTTGQNATLHAWIDFDKNGKFDPTEHTSIPVAQGTNNGNLTANLTWSGITVGATGNTYARFRLTSDSSINNATPGGAASSGEVEDYQIAIASASDPNLLLVKRITAINPGKPDEIQFNNFVDDSTSSDNNTNWPNPNIYLRGAIDADKVKPGDEVEYTVYFLSNGQENAKEVKICDVVPDQMTFMKNTYGVELGIGLGFDSTVLPTSPNLKLSNLLNDDQGDFYGPGTTPPANLCKKVNSANTLVNVNGTNNNNGAIVVKIQDLPKANTSGSPTDSYGFIRFHAKVK
jgi:uncharacterized repeat protein (TIGR01451 family)